MILITDFGSQYTQLIARKIRESNVFCEVVPHTKLLESAIKLKPKGIILSGGPSSVNDENAPQIDPKIFDLKLPVLGICYGLQLIAQHFKGTIASKNHQEYGHADLEFTQKSPLLKNINSPSTVWMSHGDSVVKLPEAFEIIASTATCKVAAIENKHKNFYGIQFHPEVSHSKNGKQIIDNFIFDICKCNADWTPDAFIETNLVTLKKRIGEKKVICGLSGGVDSSVVAVLLQKAIGKQLTCIYIDHGMMRKNETENIKALFEEKYAIDVIYVDASEHFLGKLAGVTDPEKKRKIIGEAFIRTFEAESKKLAGDYHFLAQGTLYPDVIESATVGVSNTAHTIKTHHNVGGLPDEMDFEIIEPLKMLFKDEVRQVGKALGMPDETVYRHPFPGPGLAIRILGEINANRIQRLQQADAIFIEEIRKADLYNDIWQALAVLLPIKSVGVKGDGRSYEECIAIRAVESTDAMTANWFDIPGPVLRQISRRILNEVPGINRVVYDISDKPPATIEWE